MSDQLLNVSAVRLMDDPSSHHKVLWAMKLSSGRGYMDEYNNYVRAVQQTPNGSVADVLSATGIDPASLVEDLRTLEQLSAAKTRANKQALRLLDDGGPVAESGNPAIDDDTYAAIKQQAPRPVWQRLQAARRLPGGSRYEGDVGAKRFSQEDELHAESGVDFLRVRSHEAQTANAAAMAGAFARRLDDAVEKGGTPGERRKLLDNAIREGTRSLEQALGGAESASAATGPSRTRQGPLQPIGELRRLDSESASDRAHRLQREINRLGWYHAPEVER